jgi:hypothetical protein
MSDIYSSAACGNLPGAIARNYAEKVVGVNNPYLLTAVPVGTMSLPWCQPESHEIDWLRSQNLLDAALDVLPRIGAAYARFHGNVFEEAPDGQRVLTFPIHDCGEFIDFAAWQPRTDQLATWRGTGFAIGQDQIFNPASYFDGGALRVHRTPFDW